MVDSTHPDRKVLRDWLGSPPDASTPDPANLVRAVLDRFAADEATAMPEAVLDACAVLLSAARSDLDRLELELMRAAGEHGVGWARIAVAFGYRSKQAAHARASALHHRLEYRTGTTEEGRR
ncbi:hypothetical protein [Nocardia terpenica]|uniref:DNA-binding protein n=1 Tax=Nocardia terpenica TaxID=455432 RepID=A0A164J6H2_9NOCA|nr:hypothetical protein [Nocardia terpenica]KZM70093.1 hypothetical protein AWN90_05845 [Nocardia terpenica]NQE91501.1 hypothetical protein [Nocardia terpenica]